MDVTEPLRGLARTSIGIGIGNLVVGVAAPLVATVRAVDHPDAPWPDWIWLFAAAFLIPGVALIVIGYRLYAGRLWAAIALLSIAVIEVPKLLIVVLPFVGRGRGWLLGLIPAALIVRCTLALPEVRFQLRAQRRAQAARGFEPILKGGVGPVRPAVTPQALPRGLKPDVGMRGRSVRRGGTDG